MAKRHLPSIEALTSSDDELLRAELRLYEVRAHVELARSLLDELEPPASSWSSGLAPHFVEKVPRTDIAEELARLGCKLVEMASALGAKSG